MFTPKKKQTELDNKTPKKEGRKTVKMKVTKGKPKEKPKDKTKEGKKEPYDLKYLGGWLMSKMAFGGAARLRSNADEVNKLNVFPVPDGDTGDNMRMTIESGIAALENIDSDNLAEVMRAFSHGMLLGARGNSGVILSQLFAGIAKGFEGKERADPETLGRALEMGVQQAYSSVMTPTEGTILTVAREAVEYAVKSITPQSTIRSFFADLVGEMHESLERTPENLEILKEAGVVDSGGAGLLYIMEGFNRVLNGEDVQDDGKAVPPAPQKNANVAFFGPDSVMEYGYCTELMVQLMRAKCDVENFDIEPLKEFLATVGDSIVCFKTDTVVKIHVHTFTPEKVFEYCRSFGEFIAVKVENMSVQHTELSGAAAEAKAPAEKKQYGVVAVTNGPGVAELYRQLGADEIIPGGQTSNPSTNDFLDAFGRINAEHIFVFPNNGNILMAAQQAANFYEDAAVHVIPSKDVGRGYVALSSVDFSEPDPDVIIEQMKDAMQNVESGFVSTSIRDVEMNGVRLKKGDTIGIIDKKIVLADPDKGCAAYRLGVKLLDKYGKSMLTVFCGKDTTDEEKDVLRQCIEENCPSAEIYFIDGGQDIYPYIFVAE